MIIYSNISCPDRLQELSIQWLPYQKGQQVQEESYLLWTDQDLVLYENGKPFLSAKQCYGSVTQKQHHYVLKAVERKGRKPEKMLDATAGWGRESLTLAQAGIKVTAVEQSLLPVVFLHYAVEYLFPHIPIQILHGELSQLLPQLSQCSWPCLYVDPLFFDDKPSLSKKEMEFLYQQPETLGIQQDCHDILLKTSLMSLKMDMLVIKQHKKAQPWIVSSAIGHSQKSTKTCKYDIYYINGQTLVEKDFSI